MKEEIKEIRKLLREMPWQAKKQAEQIEAILPNLESDALHSEKIEDEYIDEKGNYVKSEGRKVEQVGFWLRFIVSHWIPCESCQKELLRIIHDAFSDPKHELHIGNKDYEPAIELWKKSEIDDNSWKIIETRLATEDEKKRLIHFD